MTKEDIIRMAREAGSIDSEEVIETVWRAFSAVEREACAKVCDDNAHTCPLLPDDCEAAITALRAALAQQAEPTWVCPDSPEHRYAKPGHCEDCGKTLVQEQGCDHCNHPLYAATKCRVCGRVTEQAEPVEEPYCYVYEYDGVFGMHREFYPKTYNGQKPSRTVPVYTAPPQRKPLTDGEISDLWCEVSNTDFVTADTHEFARAIERAHGITDPQVKDRLARHGIPMPEGDPK